MTFARQGGRTLALTVLSLLGAALVMQACTTDRRQEPPEERLVLERVSFEELPGWTSDSQEEALEPLRRSCAALDKRADDDPLDRSSLGGSVRDWRAVCHAAETLFSLNTGSARAFFEEWFAPYEIRGGSDAEGLFTGYFEPELRGANVASADYSVPLHQPPDDLVVVDLGLFRPDLAGERIVGRMAGRSLEPYATRAEIDAGALKESGTPLVWVDDPIDAFFLHIQGSGRITFDDGGQRRISYAATNGHAYFPIGRKLIELGALSREEVSMPSIRDWLEANPAEADDVMRENRSYVFFRWLEDDKAALGPVGAQGVPLTPGRSLAVDRRFVPLSAPLWLETNAPDPDPTKADRPVQRLLIAQDTGGAIRGPVRGDVFWGTGDEAGSIAGRMKHQGRYWILLPTNLDVTGLLD
jgi:membrane-bound lytic murein transglycosylase A